MQSIQQVVKNKQLGIVSSLGKKCLDVVYSMTVTGNHNFSELFFAVYNGIGSCSKAFWEVDFTTEALKPDKSA